MTAAKSRWQRESRAAFKTTHGYSSTANYGVGGLRERVLRRDRYRCAICGMTDAQHKAKWGRPITIDHKDKDRANNAMENLQTLCLVCHGRKDLLPQLRAQKVPEYKEEILLRRAAGQTFQVIADDLQFSIASIWKWVKRWEMEKA